MEILYQELKRNLFLSNSHPFPRRMIVVPSPAMKSWLIARLANDPEMAVAMGLEISYLDATVQKLQALSGLEPFTRQLKPLELSLAIQYEISQVIGALGSMDEAEYHLWRPLCDYLKVFPHQPFLSKKNEARLLSLSELLAQLFFKYGKYGSRLLSSWQGSEEWQVLLWQRVFTSWDPPYKFLRELPKKLSFCRKDLQLHLFAVSHIPDLFFHYFTKVASELPTYLYVLSPCLLFWSDLTSDKEMSQMIRSLRRVEVSEGKIEALQEYLLERNSLLANLGKLGQKMACQMEESLGVSHELYSAPKTVTEHVAYQELIPEHLILEESSHPLTLLEALKADLLLLRNPETSGKVVLEKDDRTIQFHAAPNPMREMEVLYDLLLSLVHKHREGKERIDPGKIVVMSPDIERYLPYIKAQFEGPESHFKIELFDHMAPMHSAALQPFLNLLSLPFSRWDVSVVIELFSASAFQKRHGFKREDLENLKEWIKLCGVRWGADSQHRNDLLKRDHCRHNMVEETAVGTWEHGIERMLNGLVMRVGLSSSSEEGSPLTIDYSHEQLLSKWIALLRSLRADLAPLNDGSKMPLVGWVKYLETLYDSYFSQDEEGNKGADALQDYFEQLEQSGVKLKGMEVTFSTPYYYLKQHLSKANESYRETDLQAIKFCAMLPMRAIPADVVVLIGMSENSYPRQENISSLDLLQKSPLADYAPSQPDYDRFLFLEALLSAKKYFIATYCNGVGDEGKPPAPSLLLTELSSYIDKAFEGDRSASILTKHPFYSFDKEYFRAGGAFQSFSKLRYLMAKAYYQKEKPLQKNFIDSFAKTSFSLNEVQESTVKITLKELTAFAKNPLKSYFNKTLGIYLKSPEERMLKNEEEFQLSHLQSFMMKKEALKLPPTLIVEKAAQAALLPVGPFKRNSIEKFEREVALMQSHLKELGVLPSQLVKIDFQERFTEVTYDDQGNCYAPPLSFVSQGICFQLTGTLEEVSSLGLIARLKDEKSDIVKGVPAYLLYCLLVRRHHLPFQPHLLLIGGKKAALKKPFFEDPKPLLEEYLHYYLEATLHPSPLIPEWVPDLVHCDLAAFQEKKKGGMINPFQPIYNDYLLWGGRDNLDSGTLYSGWEATAKRLFATLYDHWY